jgi:ubiquitin-conjugating enzyme E2 H
MNSNAAANKRKERDLMKLLMSNYEVSIPDEQNRNDFYVIFNGPKESPYESVSLINISV